MHSNRSCSNVLMSHDPHSFIPAISIAPLQVLYHSEALPTTARILYRSFTLLLLLLLILFIFCGWSKNLEWSSSRSDAPRKQCLFSIPPPSQDCFSAWPGSGLPLSRYLEGALYKF